MPQLTMSDKAESHFIRAATRGQLVSTARNGGQKAAECLKKDRDPLLAFYDFPAEHLETPAHVESDRKHLRDRPAQDDPLERMPLEQDRARHGVQVGRRRAEDLAPP